VNSTMIAYGDDIPGFPLADIPSEWRLKIELVYPGRVVVLVFGQEPANEELRDLMWDLQYAAGKAGYSVAVVQPDGVRLSAPAIGPTP
jgi:hypothetical protein